MDKETTTKLQKILEKEKAKLTKQLRSFAKQDPRLKGDWDTKFPQFGDQRADQDENVDEVERYENLLPIEHTLESRLADIDSALEKIKKGEYGKCEKCHKPIEEKRLEVVPEARLCMKCKNIK
jgi:DnaK suppressor protein